MGYNNVEGYTKTFGEKRTITNLAENAERADKVEYMKAVADKSAQLNKVDFLEYLAKRRQKDNEYVVEEEKTDKKAEIITLNRNQERISGGDER